MTNITITLYLPTEPNNLYGKSDYTRPSEYRSTIRPIKVNKSLLQL